MKELIGLLEKWQTNGSEGHTDRALALAILDETQRFFGDNHDTRSQKKVLFSFLNITSGPDFLTALETTENRERWSELVFSIIQQTNYSLHDMMVQRVTEHPHHVLFRDMTGNSSIDWTYEQIYRHLREIAGVFYKTAKSHPRVALYTENCLEGACTDLACLMFDIYDTPLSPHFKTDVLLPIINELKINIAVADTEERVQTLLKIREQAAHPFAVFSLQPLKSRKADVMYLVEESKKNSRWDIDSYLAKRRIHPVNRVATTMFTSGSTGMPKGVSFSIYNIVSKRFARAAALPFVGNVVFLCYLPLYHTFGRYLEMTGAIFWRGTYIFAGNTSAETLLSLFPRVNPTGFISIPLRWQELYERCQERIAGIESPDLREQAIREVVGTKLGWGLSAAGYLDPSVFRFFNQAGIRLNSGFGMTEATGGILMTPPGQYRDFSVGLPLPGVKTRLIADNEMQISGHYIGRYLEDAQPDGVIPFPSTSGDDWWLSTGDVFTISADGFYEIVDRVKDIYKNNRGQTVAPQVIEKKFYKVPGIKRVFLVGDNRPYNVLLIVPDEEDPLYQSLRNDNLMEYFHQIVMTANAEVAPYERVINFTLADRDFSREKGELTPKDSYNRKAIEANFKEIIEQLYQSNVVRIQARDFTILIPKWFFRDLGILETDIIYDRTRLVNTRTKGSLTLKRLKNNSFQVGHFIYQISGETVDLGLFTRQPRIWTGNPGIVGFCPVKEGWDLPMGPVSSTMSVVGFKPVASGSFPVLRSSRDQSLAEANNLIFKSYFSEREESFDATGDIGKLLVNADHRLALVLRHRLEALAYHPDEEIRCLAYRLILLKAPRPEHIQNMPTFIESGLTFLNENSIREIAASNFGKHRLDALKQRLYWYRNNLSWPAKKKHRRAFGDVLEMLYNFAILHLDYYVPVRAELSRWILHKQDPWLSKLAERYFNKLAEIFENEMEQRSESVAISVWKAKVIFEHGISNKEKERILHIFQSTTFLKESIVLTFSEPDFRIGSVPDKGIWILRLLAYKEFKHYRLSINTMEGKHYDLHVVISDNPRFRPRPETFYWLASLAGFPHGPAVAPLLGSSRPKLGVLSTQYIGGLTAWDKIRELSEIHRSSGFVKTNAWRKIFIRSFAAIFTAWHHSGFQIVPGAISPSNVSIPEMDFRETAVVLSLAGWSDYKNTISLIDPMLQDYYCKTASIYPWCRIHLEIKWIFDACIESLGLPEARKFLEALKKDVEGRGITCYDASELKSHVERYLAAMSTHYYIPLAVFNAIDQYQEWSRMNPLISAAAREQTIIELLELYRLQDHPELIRYYFYRHTYFSNASEEIRTAFDRLLSRMEHHMEGLAIQLIELSDLQMLMTDAFDKAVFSRMVFPLLQSEQNVDFLKVGENRKEHLVVRFTFHDRIGRKYILREPIEARETGQLYQLFFRENYPKEISDYDHQYVLTDEEEKIVGGITFRFLEDNNVMLDGIVVKSALQGNGIASAMIENFFTSVAARGVEIIKAHFLFGNYYLKNYFEIDQQWGALIKRLN